MKLLEHIRFDHLQGYRYGYDKRNRTIVFVHGGPGSHCHLFPKILETDHAFSNTPYNWLLFDQRNCGASQKLKVLDHRNNIADLMFVFSGAETRLDTQVIGSVGHSYGAWLLYNTLMRAAQSGKTKTVRPAILLAINPNRLMARHRNFLIELVEAKLMAKSSYQDFVKSLPAQYSEEGWKEKDRLRNLDYARNVRGLFYWANLEAKSRYEQIKNKCEFVEDDKVFCTVRDSVYLDPVETIELQKLPVKSALVLGYQDFLMGGETYADDPDVVTFFKSSHYPHIEQSADFCQLINQLWS